MSCEYSTDNMAVASYLDLNGVKYETYRTGIGRNGKTIVQFVFQDDKGIARDLERSYRNSSEKRYRDSLLFFRNEVFKALEEEKKGVSNG